MLKLWEFGSFGGILSLVEGLNKINFSGGIT